MNWRKIILDGLLLPLRLYCQPTAFADEVAALVPELPRDYSLWQARHKLREPAFQQALITLALQCVVALLWTPFIAFLLQQVGLLVDLFGVVAGIAFGVAGGVIVSIVFGVVGGVAFGVAGGVAFGVAGGAVGGVARGVAFGVVFGFVFGVAPILASRLAGGLAGAVAFAIASGLMGGVAGSVAFVTASTLVVTHLTLYLPQLLLSAIGWLLSRFSSSLWRQRLWQVAPVRWDEIILLPLPGLVGQLKQLFEDDLEFGMVALHKVARHRFQAQVAYIAFALIEVDFARSLTSLEELAAFKELLNWPDALDEKRLPEVWKQPLLKLRATSDEVSGALEADSLTTKQKRLTEARRILDAPGLATGAFSGVIPVWQRLLDAALAETAAALLGREPVRQVYFKGGKPIQPDDLPEENNPFKGRRRLAQQLEELLDGEQRATLLLIGTRRVGKSSLLLNLPRRLGHKVIPAFLNLQDEKLQGQNAASLLTGLAETLSEQARRNATRYHRAALHFPPLDRAALQRDPYPAFGRWLDKLEKELGDRTLLLCLDEFEQLEEALAAGRLDKRVLDLLRSIIQYRRRFAVLLSGVSYPDELPPHWASALVNTQLLPISFLERDEAEDLIRHPVRDFPAVYEAETVAEILRLTHCQPYLVQLLCGLLVERLNPLILKGERPRPPDARIPVTDLVEVVPLALAQGDAYFSDLWQSRTGGPLARKVLERLAKASNEQATSAEVKRLTDDEEGLRAAVQGLLRREIIERVTTATGETGYRITVPLVAAYVRKVREEI